jgi:hypothetical protein
VAHGQTLLIGYEGELGGRAQGVGEGGDDRAVVGAEGAAVEVAYGWMILGTLGA